MSEQLFAFEPLPSERCPGCGRATKVVLWSQDVTDGMLREYRCTGCGAKWSVEGRQEELAFDFEEERPALALEAAS